MIRKVKATRAALVKMVSLNCTRVSGPKKADVTLCWPLPDCSSYACETVFPCDHQACWRQHSLQEPGAEPRISTSWEAGTHTAKWRQPPLEAVHMSSHMGRAKGTEGRGASSQFIHPVLQRPPHRQLYSLELAPLPDLSPGNLVSDNKTPAATRTYGLADGLFPRISLHQARVPTWAQLGKQGLSVDLFS